MKNLNLQILDGDYSVWRCGPDHPLPEFTGGPIWSITRTEKELSVISPSCAVPPGVQADSGWRCIAVQGPLPLELTGTLSSLAEPLAAAGLALFALSTFDTDYLLVKGVDLSAAKVALEQHGHRFVPESENRGRN